MLVDASTGPRHRCRGSADERHRPRLVGHCFNGASASLPRIGRLPMGVVVEEQQLQRGLGIAAEDRSSRIARRSHAKQLQRGLGIAAEDRRPRSTSPLRAPRFNGASASLPRIGLRATPSGSRPRCFNGASASLPRIGPGRGSSACPSCSCFNGASASLPRIVLQKNTCVLLTIGFNGASASLPRIALHRERQLRQP